MLNKAFYIILFLSLSCCVQAQKIIQQTGIPHYFLGLHATGPHDQMRRRRDDFLILLNLRFREAGNIFPAVFWQKARRIVKAILFVRLFHIDLYAAIVQKLRMHDLGLVIQR